MTSDIKMGGGSQTGINLSFPSFHFVHSPEEEKVKMDFECSVSEYLISENIKVKTHLKRSLFVMLKTDNQTAHRGAYSHLLMKMLLK